MAYGSIISIFDRLSVKATLSNYTGSYAGFFATLAFIAVCLIVLIPPANQYFKGAYFESEFKSYQTTTQTYSTGNDIIIGIVFKNGITGQIANHTEIMQILGNQVYYRSVDKNYQVLYMDSCKPQVFKNAINPMTITDCIMLPSDLQYQLKPSTGIFPKLSLVLNPFCTEILKCRYGSLFIDGSQLLYQKLSRQYYYEVIFNSKVIDDKGRYANQFHKLYSTSFGDPDSDSPITEVGVFMSQKKYIVDDSILPWWNNRTLQNIFWDGTSYFLGLGSSAQLGFYTDYVISSQYITTYRYYKKLDFLLGMIGGTVFLIFLFFWVPCSYYNRTLQQMNNAEELLLIRDDEIKSEQNLHKVHIPWHYFFTKWLPSDKTSEIVQTAEHEIDIVRLIKKLKVTHRNLRVKGANLVFKSKDVDLTVDEPDKFVPDLPVLENYEITHEAYRALVKSPSTGQIYETNPVALALTENNNSKIDAAMQDEHYEKVKILKKSSCKSFVLKNFSRLIKLFDVFGARPMLNAEPEASSCWGFLLTLVIILLSCLTFALTIKNMDSVKIIVNRIVETPEQHNYDMTTGKDLKLAFCVPALGWSFLASNNRTVQVTFYKQSKAHGYQEMEYKIMAQGELQSYFELDANQPFTDPQYQNCFRLTDDQNIQMGGTYSSDNEAYFGVRLDPYCNALPSECLARKNQTIQKYLLFANTYAYYVYTSENKYSPEEGRIVHGISAKKLSYTKGILNATALRTQTLSVSSIELLDDTDKSFLRNPPKRLAKKASFASMFEEVETRKGTINADPGYVLEIRPNGSVMQIIKRSYKIDFLLGIIGGCFLFWHFFVHFLAKFYNSYKVRAKLAEVLHSEDNSDESILVHFLYLLKVPASFCCCLSNLKKDLERVSLVDQKIERDLDYLNLVKSTDTCYKLSTALFDTAVEKDLAGIYFKEKIDESELVKPKRINELKSNEFEDDEFLGLDEEQNLNDQTLPNGSSNVIAAETTAVNIANIDVEKMINLTRSKESCPLYDSLVPNKKQSIISRIVKRMDVFRTPAELTFEGEREVKSICGAIMFFILATLVIIVCFYFLRIYTTGSDFTVSQRRLVDYNLDVIDMSNTFGELSPGIQLTSGENFKFAVSFSKKDHYYNFNVSQFIGPVGLSLVQYTVKKQNGAINETTEFINLEPCKENYFEGFFGPYDDRSLFENISLGYCLPDGKTISLVGTAEDKLRTYFMFNIYDNYMNQTGRDAYQNFMSAYIFNLFMSAPKTDVFAHKHDYQIIKINVESEPQAITIYRNFTFTKNIFTNKYYENSRQTYAFKANKYTEKQMLDYMMDEHSRNVTFYYSGIIDHYTLDYPTVAELFGLVGGVIAVFIFFVYSCVSSFNEYRMKYLIGQRLYTFDKKLSGLSKEKGKRPSLKKIEEGIKKINTFNEAELLLAWILNPIGYMRDDYNFNKILRRVTLIIDKVENDINLFNVYQNLMTYKDSLDKKLKLAPSEEGDYSHIKLSSIYIKTLYNPDPTENHIHVISREAKKHKLSSYDQVKIKNAMEAKIDPKSVLGDKILNRAFGIDDGSSVYKGNMEDEKSEVNGNNKGSKNTMLIKVKASNQGEQNGSHQKLFDRRQQNEEDVRKVENFSIDEDNNAHLQIV